MKPQIVHFKKKPHDVYIGRPSKWGNPFSSKPGIAKFQVSTKVESLNKHRDWILANTDFMDEIKQELRGKVLGCWCENPLACHGYILWKVANDQPLTEISFKPEVLF